MEVGPQNPCLCHVTLHHKMAPGHSWVDLWAPNLNLADHFLSWRLELGLRNRGCLFFQWSWLDPPKLSTERSTTGTWHVKGVPKELQTLMQRLEEMQHMRVSFMQVQQRMFAKEMKMRKTSVLEMLPATLLNLSVYLGVSMI